MGGNILGVALGGQTPYPGRASGVVRINGQILSNIVSVAADRDFSLALKKDGTAVTWGCVEKQVAHLPSGLTNIVAVAAEWGFGWALRRDGTVVRWVTNPSWPGYGELSPLDGFSNVIAIAVGPGGYNVTRGVALRRDGTVRHWGNETDQKAFATPPAGLSNVVAVAAGAAHSLALKNDGTIVGWGWNGSGEATGVPSTNAPLARISAGQVRIGGQILSNVVSIAAARGYSMALQKDGTVVAWGRMENGRSPTVPAGLSNVVAIAAGEDFCLAITTNNAVAERFRH